MDKSWQLQLRYGKVMTRLSQVMARNMTRSWAGDDKLMARAGNIYFFRK